MKILFTAFKGANNTSFQLINQLDANAVLLTNSFNGVEKDIVSVGDSYDVIYMFGVDKTLMNKVRIESCAHYNGEMINTDYDIFCLEKRLKSVHIACEVSDVPAKYLCNAAYYHMLKKYSNTVFIHIPSIKGMSERLLESLKCFCIDMIQSKT